MTQLSQGDIVRIGQIKQNFLVVSKNAFIKYTGMFHVCPFPENINSGPLHIEAAGINGTVGVAAAEQIKLIDPSTRSCRRIDRIPYSDMMNISDAIQGIFEYG